MELAGVRRLLREHVIEEAAEGEDVRTLVHRLATRLFGRHVRGRPHTFVPGGRRERPAEDRAEKSRRVVVASQTLRRSLASPQSITTVSPNSPMTTFEGLRSRSMIPCSCAYAMASAIESTCGKSERRASNDGVFAMTSPSVLPSTSFMA